MTKLTQPNKNTTQNTTQNTSSPNNQHQNNSFPISESLTKRIRKIRRQKKSISLRSIQEQQHNHSLTQIPTIDTIVPGIQGIQIPYTIDEEINHLIPALAQSYDESDPSVTPASLSNQVQSPWELKSCMNSTQLFNFIIDSSIKLSNHVRLLKLNCYSIPISASKQKLQANKFDEFFIIKLINEFFIIDKQFSEFEVGNDRLKIYIVDFKIRFHSLSPRIQKMVNQWLYGFWAKDPQAVRPRQFVLKGVKCEQEFWETIAKGDKIKKDFGEFFSFELARYFDHQNLMNNQGHSHHLERCLLTLLKLKEETDKLIPEKLQKIKELIKSHKSQESYLRLVDDFFVTKMTYVFVYEVLKLGKVSKNKHPRLVPPYLQSYHEYDNRSKPIYRLKELLQQKQLNLTHKYISNYLSRYQSSTEEVTLKLDAEWQLLKQEFYHLMIEKKTCQICYCQYHPSELEKVFSCTHQFCSHCISAHIKEKCKAFTEIYCPDSQCHQPINQSSQFYQNLSQQLKNKHKRIQKLNFVNNDPYLRLCTRQDCEGIMPVLKGEEVRCPVCERRYCEDCLNAYHLGDCLKNEVYFLQNQLKFRRCSQCKHVVEKSQGCNHMKCICKFEFCYICGDKWNEDHFGCQHERENQRIRRRRAGQREERVEREERERRRMAEVYGTEEQFDIRQVMRMSAEMYAQEMQLEMMGRQVFEIEEQQQLEMALAMSMMPEEDFAMEEEPVEKVKQEQGREVNE